MKASELKKIPFPDCYENCEIGNYLGVGECESVCAFKFKEPDHLESKVMLKDMGREEILTKGDYNG